MEKQSKQQKKKQKKQKEKPQSVEPAPQSALQWTNVTLGEGFVKKNIAVSLSFNEVPAERRPSARCSIPLAGERGGEGLSALQQLFGGLTAAAPPTSQQVFDRFPAEHISSEVINLSYRLHRHQLTQSEACQQLLQGFRRLVETLDPKREGKAALAQKVTVARGVLELFGVLEAALLNILNFVAAEVEELPAELNDEARAALLTVLDNCHDRRFTMADALLVEYCLKAIAEGDRLLVCNASSILERVLVAAHRSGRAFSLTLLSSPALPQNTRMAQSLDREGVPVTFAHINNLPFLVERASKVFVKGLNVFSNGWVRALPGSAALTLFAAKHRKPVYVVARTLCFCEDCPADPLDCNSAEAWPGVPRGHQLLYDLIPPHRVSLLITEIGPVPTPSVPMVIAESRSARP